MRGRRHAGCSRGEHVAPWPAGQGGAPADRTGAHTTAQGRLFHPDERMRAPRIAPSVARMPPPPPVVAALSPAAAASEPVELALALSELSGAPLVVVVVVARGRWHSRELRVSRTVWHTERELARRGIRGADIRVAEDDTPARGLARALDRLRPSMIAVGPRRAAEPGEARLGTTARRVLHVSSCPVAIVPRGYARPAGGVRAVGAAFVATPEGWAAVRAAAAIVRRADGRLRAIRAIHPEESCGPDTDAELRRALAELAADLPFDVE